MESAVLKTPATSEAVNLRRRHAERWAKHVDAVKQRKEMRDRLLNNLAKALGARNSYVTWSEFISFSAELITVSMTGIILAYLLM